MVRICMLVHQSYLRDGRVRRYTESLVQDGVSVHVLCVKDSSADSHSPQDGLVVHTIPVVRNYKGRGNYLIEYLASLCLYAVCLLWLQLRYRFQVIHVHNMPDFLVFAAAAPRLLGAKIILDIHDPMPEFYQSKFRKDATDPVVRIMYLQEKVSARLANEIITANSNFKANLSKRGISSAGITVVNNVPDPAIFNRELGRDAADNEDGDEDGHFILIYPGTIAARYGLNVVIAGLALLTGRYDNIRLRIIGPRVEYVEELKCLAERHAVSSRVEFRPAVPINRIAAEIARASAGIYPALPDPHMEIATPTKVLEYAFMGIPIISSRLPIVQQLFSASSVLFFEAGNSCEFAQCVARLYDNPALRSELTASADREFVRCNSWSAEYGKYCTVLTRLLEEKHIS